MIGHIGRSLICVCKVTHYFSNTKAFSMFFFNVDFIHTFPYSISRQNRQYVTIYSLIMLFSDILTYIYCLGMQFVYVDDENNIKQEK